LFFRNKFLGGAPVFNWHEIRKRKRKGSKSRPHSSPDPSCGREKSRGGAIPFPQKNSLPRRPVRRSFSGGGVQISFQDFRQKMFEHQSKNTANWEMSLLAGGNLKKLNNMDEKVKQYIDKQKSPQKEILQKIRRLIQEVEPSATEAMSYGVPAFKLNGNVIMYAAFANHIGIYPEPDTVKFFAKELVGYETAKGTIQFNLAEPVPYSLIEKIVKYRFGATKTNENTKIQKRS